MSTMGLPSTASRPSTLRTLPMRSRNLQSARCLKTWSWRRSRSVLRQNPAAFDQKKATRLLPSPGAQTFVAFTSDYLCPSRWYPAGNLMAWGSLMQTSWSLALNPWHGRLLPLFYKKNYLKYFKKSRFFFTHPIVFLAGPIKKTICFTGPSQSACSSHRILWLTKWFPWSFEWWQLVKFLLHFYWVFQLIRLNSFKLSIWHICIIHDNKIPIKFNLPKRFPMIDDFGFTWAMLIHANRVC